MCIIDSKYFPLIKKMFTPEIGDAIKKEEEEEGGSQAGRGRQLLWARERMLRTC